VTSGVTVDSHYPPNATQAVQTVAIPQMVGARDRADRRAGRAMTVRRVPLMSPTLLSVRDVAGSLRVHCSTVYSLCNRGELEHVRVSNAIRIRVEAVEAFLRSRMCEEPGSPAPQPPPAHFPNDLQRRRTART